MYTSDYSNAKVGPLEKAMSKCSLLLSAYTSKSGNDIKLDLETGKINPLRHKKKKPT